MHSWSLIPSNCKNCKTGCYRRKFSNFVKKKKRKKISFLLELFHKLSVRSLLNYLTLLKPLSVFATKEAGRKEASSGYLERILIFQIANTTDYCCCLHALKPMTRLGKERSVCKGFQSSKKRII